MEDEVVEYEFKKCEHLLYIGTNEAGFEYVNEGFQDLIKEEMD